MRNIGLVVVLFFVLSGITLRADAQTTTTTTTTPAPGAGINCSTLPEGSPIAAGCTLPPGTQPDPRPRDSSGNLVIPSQAGGMDFEQFKAMTCPNPCNLSIPQLQSNFASFAGLSGSGGSGIPLPGGFGGSSGDSGSGGGGGDSSGSCAAAAGGGFGALSTMFGPNLTAGVANQLVQNGLIPKEVADILSMPNAPADRVAWAMQQLKDRGLPTNPLDLAKNTIPLVNTGLGMAGRGLLDNILDQVGPSLNPIALNALNIAKAEALGNGGQLTQVARDALGAAGLPTTAGGLAQAFNIDLSVPSEMSQTMGSVDNLTPSELQDIEEALTIVSGFEGLGDGNITQDDMTKALSSLGTLGQDLGIGNLSTDDAAELIDGLNDLNDAAEKAKDGDGNPDTTANTAETEDDVAPEDIDAFLDAVASDPDVAALDGDEDLTASSIADMYDDIEDVDDSSGGNAQQIFDNLGPLANAFSPFTGVSVGGGGGAGATGSASPQVMMDAFQKLSILSTGNPTSTQSIGAMLNFASQPANTAAVSSALGLSPQQTTTWLNNMKGLNGIQNMNLTSVTGALSAAQRVMSSGVLKNVDITKVSGVFKSLTSKIKLPQFASKLKNLSKVKSALAKFSKIKGLGGQALSKLKGFSSKLKNLDIVKKLGLDKFNKIIKAPDFLKKLNSFGADKLKAALDKIKNFGPAQLQKLFAKMPKLPIDRLNKLLSGGLSKLEGAISKIPGADRILSNFPGGLGGAISALGSLNFSSAGCLFQSLLTKAMCMDGPTPTDCKGDGVPNASTGAGKDDTYKNYCFKGPLTPRPKIVVRESKNEADQLAAEQEAMDKVLAIEPDYDKGADGAKSRECITHKDTETKALLKANGGWLWVEHVLDSPVIDDAGVVVTGQSPYYKDTDNEHKLKGALVNGLGGVYSTTFGSGTDSGVLTRLKCDTLGIPDCPGWLSPMSMDERAQWNRLAYDACTNKYVFNLMMGLPGKVGDTGNKANTEGMKFIFDPLAIRGEANYDQTWCQPFKMIPTQCEPDLMNLRGMVGNLAGDLAGGVVATQYNQALGGRGGVFGDAVSGAADDYVTNAVGGGGANGGKCIQKTCEKKNCGRDKADKFDYEAWRYLARGWISVLDTRYFPTRVPDLPNAGDEAALATLRKNQNTGPNRGRVGGFMDETWKNLGDDMAKDSWGSVDVQINGLIRHPYERIWDPTHPYSPRYDYSGNERDMYSPMAAAYFEFSPCEVRCAAVKVDLMSFRHPQFSKCMGCRLAVNTTCFWVEVAAQTICPGPCIPLPAAIANSRKGTSPIPVCATPLKIAKKWPPCNTKFDVNGGKDNVPPMCYGCVLASGDPNPLGGVKKCCSDLAKPIAPINTLKIRSKPDMSRKPPEGYEFAQYFDDHKPYMRWWDTGGEAGSPGSHDQMSKCGSRDVLVGVGTEQRGCNNGGGKGQSVQCINVGNPDPLSSWTELKMYQTNTYRTYRMNCLGQYEKLFKSNSAEDFVLARIGKSYNSLDERGQASPHVFGESWRGYVTDTSDDRRFPKQYKGSNFAKSISKPYGDLPQGLDNARKGDILIWDKKVNADRMPHVAIVVDTNVDNPKVVEKEKVVAVREMNAGKYPDACGTTDAWGMGTTRYLHKHCIVFEGKKAMKGSDSQPLGEEENFYEPFLKTGVVASSPNGGGVCYVAKKPDYVDGPFTFGCEDPNLQACEERDWNKVIIYRPCADSKNPADCRD